MEQKCNYTYTKVPMCIPTVYIGIHTYIIFYEPIYSAHVYILYRLSRRWYIMSEYP